MILLSPMQKTVLTKTLLLFTCLILLSASQLQLFGKDYQIAIQASELVLNEPVSKLAIDDVQELLSKACSCNVGINQPNATIYLNLPEPSQVPFKKIKHQKGEDGVPYFYYPNTNFEWIATEINKQLYLKLNTSSYEGIAAALYALLQEHLGFRFYHPREMIIPELKDFPIEEGWTFTGKERFLKRGFHLHTQHPIELTEALLDHNSPNGLAMVKEYIDWLARNSQNYFEFNLLRTVDIKEWIPYAKQLTDYAHQRGIIMGIDISLHMIQQKAYMLYKLPPKSFKKKTKQVIQNLNILKQANWDVYNIELSSTEYTKGNTKRRDKLAKLILDWSARNDYKIMGRAHVVKSKEGILNYPGKNNSNDAERGVMIHTVMFYTIDEESAPVYNNENQKHMLDLMNKEQPVRETWYFPESAYWVTFDSSVPMLLLPYLSARLSDIQLMEKKGITGHLTFSSGWEWGYGLIDWSIARWSWDYGKPQHPTDALELLFENEKLVANIDSLLELQKRYMKDKNLIAYLVAQTVNDEVLEFINIQFHPIPKWRYKYLFRKANQQIIDSLKKQAIDPLDTFYKLSNQVLEQLRSVDINNEKTKVVLNELLESVEITNLRVLHRKYILQSIYQYRKNKIEKNNSTEYLEVLEKATEVRQQALKIVQRREAGYRYDTALLSSKRKGHTTYHFGYLYPVHQLHFWEREEAQIKKNRWGFPHKNIWPVFRIIGL